MPVIRAADAVTREMHGTRFTSYIRPGTGSTELCVWQIQVPAGLKGVPHKVLREEAFVIIAGVVTLTIDGQPEELRAGDAALAPAGSTINLDNNGTEAATLVVTVPVGFQGELPDGTVINPPWTS
ncbi:cupin domain-containing protein [Nocardia sp. NPDC052112]|uniref:cupin domain-containing protein n=1 Tax=Nocardia sp. NPDC052112 TaxID=3155646 RepID=UPI00342D265D